MKTLVTMVLLLTPPQLVHAALITDVETCCAGDARLDTEETLNARGARLYAAGDYSNAEKDMREALRIEEAKANPHPADLAGTLFNLAAVIRMQSRLGEAAALYNRAIALRESTSGPDSPELGRPLAGLALVYLSQGKVNQAVEVAERASRLNTADVRQKAVVHNTLATILLARGDVARAEDLQRQVAEELQRAGATNTQEYVNAVANLGTSRLRQANYRQAELDLREAEKAALSVAGPDHPLTAAIWNNLAKVRAGQGDWKGAEALLQKALAAWRKTVGPSHPDVAQGLTNLASLYQGRKRYADAERLYRQALDIDNASLGPDSLQAANSWNNLGALYSAQHHYAKAESTIGRGLAIAERRVGNDHPDTASIGVNLAVVYLSQRKYREASELFAKALPVRERELGKDSPELANLLRWYAAALKGDHDYVASQRAELKATRISTHNALLAQR